MCCLAAVSLIIFPLLAAHTIVDHVDGDLLIGFVDNVGDYNASNLTSRVQNAMSFIHTLSNSSLWPSNGSIGYVIYSADSADFSDNGLELIIEVLTHYPKLIAIVGFRKVTEAIQITSFISSIRLPVYTYANGIMLDNLLAYPSTDYMTRITSYSSTQVRSTIPDILEKLEVNIASVIYDSDKVNQFSGLTQEFDLGNYPIDMEYSAYFEIDKPDTNIGSMLPTGLMEQIFGDKSMSNATRLYTVVVLLASRNIPSFLEYLNQDGSSVSDLLLIFDSSSCILDYNDNNDYSTLLGNNVHAMRLCQTYYEVPGLMNYMKNYELYSYNSDNGTVTANSEVLSTWHKGIYGDECAVFNQTNSSCNIAFADAITSTDNLANDINSRYNHRIYYTLLKVLKSLENVTKQQVWDVGNRTFAELFDGPFDVGELIYNGFLKNNVELPENTNFLKYNSSTETWANDYEVIYETDGKSWISTWNSVENLTFTKFIEDVKNMIMNSTEKHLPCSIDCLDGNRTVLDSKLVNCWSCEPCTGNTYSEHGNWTSCKTCDFNLTNPRYANDNRTECSKTASSVNIRTTAGKFIWVMASVNICILLITAGVYIKYRKSRVIVSSGRDLLAIMFVGILVGHIEAMLIAMVPTGKTCFVIQILAHVFMVLTVCPLLVKTFRIWLVFRYSLKLGKKVKEYIADWIIMLECALLALPQLILLALGLILDDSYKFIVNYVEESLDPDVVVTMSCGPKKFAIILASILYTALLLIISTVLGWSCRKLPDNFKESMHIFLSSLISLLLISVYVPAMLTMAGYTQVTLLAAVITIISLTLTIVIFVPKAYIVLFVSPIKQKQMFRSTNRSSTPIAPNKPPSKEETSVHKTASSSPVEV